MENTIIKSAPGRVALVGNPFDIYGGMTVALTLKDLRSYVCLSQNGYNHQEINSEIFRPGSNRASQSRTLELAVIETLDLQNKYFKLFDFSDMPYEAGFARSTAAVVAMIRAFNELFDLKITDQREIAELAWQIERKLGVCGGQERYAIACDDEELNAVELADKLKNHQERTLAEIKKSRPGKLFFMDFRGREDHRFRGQYAYLEELPWPASFKLAVAYSTEVFFSSFNYHKTLREIFLNIPAARQIVRRFNHQSELNSLEARVEFTSALPRAEVIGQKMSNSFLLRQRLLQELLPFGMQENELTAETQKIYKGVMAAGALGANQPGSKSIVFLYQDDRVIEELRGQNYHLILFNSLI